MKIIPYIWGQMDARGVIRFCAPWVPYRELFEVRR